eukprot:scaffold54626_cov36-Phaeocystis_antarctica.AAC.2
MGFPWPAVRTLRKLYKGAAVQKSGVFLVGSIKAFEDYCQPPTDPAPPPLTRCQACLPHRLHPAGQARMCGAQRFRPQRPVLLPLLLIEMAVWRVRAEHSAFAFDWRWLRHRLWRSAWRLVSHRCLGRCCCLGHCCCLGRHRRLGRLHFGGSRLRVCRSRRDAPRAIAHVDAEASLEHLVQRRQCVTAQLFGRRHVWRCLRQRMPRHRRHRCRVEAELLLLDGDLFAALLASRVVQPVMRLVIGSASGEATAADTVERRQRLLCLALAAEDEPHGARQR